MSPDEEALRRLVRILDQHGIPYLLTGSIATSYHGRPRATHDADIVIDPTDQQLELLVHDLSTDFYVIRQALAWRSNSAGSSMPSRRSMPAR